MVSLRSSQSLLSASGLLVLLVGAWGLLVATPASATTANYTSPTPCSASVQNGVCLSTVTAGYGTSTISLSMTAGIATDPTTDPNWLTSDRNTDVLWAIATSSTATTPAYIAEADSNFNTPGTFSGVVFSSTDLSTLCDSTSGVTVSFDLTANSYSLSFPSTCIGSPSSVSVQANYEYSTSAGSLGVIAAAPGDSQTFRSCCTVTPDAATTTTSTSTTTTSTTTTTPTTTTSTTSSTTTTTVPTSTTTTTPVAVVSTSPSSTGTSGTSTPTGNTGTVALAATGPGSETPWLLVVAASMIVVGVSGRRRLLSVARRTLRSRVR